MAGTPKCYAAIQQDLDRLEVRAGRNIMKFNLRKCGVLQLDWINPMCQCRQGLTWKAALGLLVDNKLTMSQHCPSEQEGQWYSGLHWEEHCQQVEGGGPAALLSPA